MHVYLFWNSCIATKTRMVLGDGWMYDMDAVSFVLYTLSEFSNRQMVRFGWICEKVEDV